MTESNIGHNNPPDMCWTAGEVCMDLSRWMAEHPVIQNEAEVKEATVLIDRAVLCIKDMEDERKAQTAPLREKVKAIDDSYRGPRELLERVAGELKSRWRTFVNKIEAERAVAAEAASKDAERLREAARLAHRDAGHAIDNAAAGELGVDVSEVMRSADAAISASERADRKAAILERETKVKIKGIFRSRSLSDVEVPWIDEPVKVVADLERNNLIPEKLMDYILTAANSFKRKLGRYPEGIKVDKRRL